MHAADDRRVVWVRAEPVHERLVHLERVEREVPELPERRVAGPEVVDREAHAEPPKLLQPRAGLVRIVHDGALGHFELELRGRRGRWSPSARRTSSTRPGSRSWRGETLTLTASGSPSRRGQVAASPAGRAEHPRPDRDDQAGLLGDRDEARRADRAALADAPSAAAPRPSRSCPSPARRSAGTAPRADSGRRHRAAPSPAPGDRRPRRPSTGRTARSARARSPSPGTSPGRPPGGARRGPGDRAVLTATPMLAVTTTSRPAIRNGARSASVRRSATDWASASSSTSHHQHRQLVAAQPRGRVLGPQAAIDPAAPPGPAGRRRRDGPGCRSPP